jgi:predicted deacylase
LFSDADAIVDLHSAGKGRSNMPQIRANLAHAGSNILAKAFGIEIILDSKPPSGSLRKAAIAQDIPVVTYEGGGANVLDHESVKVAMHGVLNVLRSFRMIDGNPLRPRFRMLASGSHWLRAGEGGLLDMFVSAGSVMREGEVIATISDPGTPGITVDVVAPEDVLLIGAATNPFTAAGMPVGHFLPISKHLKLLSDQIDTNGRFLVCGSQGEAVWREEQDVDEVAVEGDWSGGSVDSEWTITKEINAAQGDTFTDNEEEAEA